MTDKVVSIRGGSVPQPGKPNPRVVKALEELLERARAGEAQGLAACFSDKDGNVGWHAAGFSSHYAMVGGLADLQKYILSQLE